jgi:hypothetical protein
MVVVVVQIGVVRMMVHQRLMTVAVRMRLALGHTRIVQMLMMFIVRVAVIVLHDGMGMLMAMRFAQVQINAHGHQRTGDDERRRKGSRKDRKRQQCAY